MRYCDAFLIDELELDDVPVVPLVFDPDVTLARMNFVLALDVAAVPAVPDVPDVPVVALPRSRHPVTVTRFDVELDELEVV